MSDKVVVHDPRGYPPKVSGKQLAPRLLSLDDKVVFLVDCLFDNSDVFMEQLQQWFAERMPTVRIKNIRPRESWVLISTACAAVTACAAGVRSHWVKVNLPSMELRLQRRMPLTPTPLKRATQPSGI